MPIKLSGFNVNLIGGMLPIPPMLNADILPVLNIFKNIGISINEPQMIMVRTADQRFILTIEGNRIVLQGEGDDASINKLAELIGAILRLPQLRSIPYNQFGINFLYSVSQTELTDVPVGKRLQNIILGDNIDIGVNSKVESLGSISLIVSNDGKKVNIELKEHPGSVGTVSVNFNFHHEGMEVRSNVMQEMFIKNELQKARDVIEGRFKPFMGRFE